MALPLWRLIRMARISKSKDESEGLLRENRFVAGGGLGSLSCEVGKKLSSHGKARVPGSSE
jgi:hypothetical protein